MMGHPSGYRWYQGDHDVPIAMDEYELWYVGWTKLIPQQAVGHPALLAIFISGHMKQRISGSMLLAGMRAG